MIDMTGWNFSVGGGRAGLAEPPKSFNFPTVLDLLLHLGAGNELPAGQIDNRLGAGARAMHWPDFYTRLNTAPHFKAYRGRKYDAYKAAALARAVGTATPTQCALAAGLSAEIASSKVIVPKGQLVLHGRSDQVPSASSVYDAFLSTTLSPFVAHLSSIRRQHQLGGRQTIFVFSLTRDLPAMWGHVGCSSEWELLFDAGLPVRQRDLQSAGSFDVVEADLG